MTIDIEALRAETPGCGGNLVHLNNAGASLMPQAVLSALVQHVGLEGRIGGYEAAIENADAIDSFYDDLARLVNGRPDEIAFFDSATRAWHTAFHAMDLQEGDVVLTARAEYNANMVSFLHAGKRNGIVLKLVPNAPDGSIDVEALEELVCARTRLICLSHIPTNDGLVNRAHAVGEVARRHGIPFLLDACQSVGQMPIDVEAIGCTMLSATGRKYLRGPRGTGFLWVRKDWIEKLEPHAIDIRSASWSSVSHYEIAADARRFELWECNVAGQIALGEAARYAMKVGVSRIWARIGELSGILRARLEGLDGFSVHDQGTLRSGIVTFSHKHLSAEEIVVRLRSENSINTSVSAVQLTRTNLISGGITHMVRASVHAYNTMSDLEALLEALEAIARHHNGSKSFAYNNKNNPSQKPLLGVEQ